MNAPPLITVTPIRRPVYNSTQKDYARWVENNMQTLVDYFNTLITVDGAGPFSEDDFFIFCRVQHDCEIDRMDELKRCYNTWSEEQ